MKKKNLLIHGITMIICLSILSCSKEDFDPQTPNPETNNVTLKASSTVSFSTNDNGKNTAMYYWAVGTADSKRSASRLGSEIDVIRIGGFQKWPLIDDNTLSPEAKSYLDEQVDKAIIILEVNPNAQISLCCSGQKKKIDNYFINNGLIRPTRYKNLFKAVKKYVLNKIQEKGYTTSIAFIEANNEPDWNKYGSKNNLNKVMSKMQNDSDLGSIPQVGPSTLNCANASKWWNSIKNNADWGATHVLGGNMYNYINFIKKVNDEGKLFYNSEAHTVAEMIVAAQYGCKGALWWYPVSTNEADFTNAQFGNRICYEEVRSNWAVAAGYKGSGNTIHLFVSSAERFGNSSTSTTFTFNCSDRAVRFDGGTPTNNYTVTIGKNDTKHIIVTW